VTIEIIDPHVHQWRPRTNPWYPMLTEAGMDSIAHDFLAAQYRQVSAGYEVSAIVHVSATTAPRAYLDEARWIDEMARAEGWPAAFLGTIDPESSWETVSADLDEQARSSFFRGIRVLFGFDPSGELAQRLVARLAADRLVFDIVAHPNEVPAYRELIDREPDLAVAVEHAGWPESGDDMAQWRTGMAALAERPNTYCKISGLAMTLQTLALDAQRPWIEGCLEIFGPDRCMFASNFPVDSLFGTFDELYSTYRTVASELDEAAQQQVFAATARQVYRI
jgi:predicted TIM-barrel fold metal-dependent hydrolase